MGPGELLGEYPDRGDPDLVGEDDLHPAHNDAHDAARPAGPAGPLDPFGCCPTCGTPPGTDATDGRLGPALAGHPLIRRAGQLLPPATVYIHLSAASLADPGTGVARFEGYGPISVQQIREFLGTHCTVTVKPVLDPTTTRAVNGYEVPTDLAEALHLRNPAHAYPWATSTHRTGRTGPGPSTGTDADHTEPYLHPDRGGPPGQTHLGNLGKLTRTLHRAKTHTRWRVHQPEPGTYLWRSPQGHHYLVDHTGTHPLPASIGRPAWTAATSTATHTHQQPPDPPAN